MCFASLCSVKNLCGISSVLPQESSFSVQLAVEQAIVFLRRFGTTAAASKGLQANTDEILPEVHDVSVDTIRNNIRLFNL